MIRDRLAGLARRILRRAKAQKETPDTAPVADQEVSRPKAEAPWYLDGQDETWGWENTNAQPEEED